MNEQDKNIKVNTFALFLCNHRMDLHCVEKEHFHSTVRMKKCCPIMLIHNSICPWTYFFCYLTGKLSDKSPPYTPRPYIPCQYENCVQRACKLYKQSSACVFVGPVGKDLLDVSRSSLVPCFAPLLQSFLFSSMLSCVPGETQCSAPIMTMCFALRWTT